MANGIRVVVRDLPLRSGRGGGLNLAFTVHEGLATQEVLEALRFWMNLVKDSAERGWPVGPERGRPHSRDLFVVEPLDRGDRTGFRLVNSADYALFIHEPGSPGRFVVDREIREVIEDLRPSIMQDLKAAFIRGFNQVGGGLT